MKRIKQAKRKTVVIGAVVAAVVLAATAAVAFYVLVSYSGSGNTTLGSAAPTADVINVTFTGSPIAAPGGTQGIHYSVMNGSGPSNKVGLVHNVISVDAGHVGCLPAWFTAPDADQGNAVVGAGSNNFPLPVDGVLSFPNIVGTDQSACKGAIVTVTATASGS